MIIDGIVSPLLTPLSSLTSTFILDPLEGDKKMVWVLPPNNVPQDGKRDKTKREVITFFMIQ